MTAQIPDVLCHRGKRLDLCSLPLDSYVGRLPKDRRPRFARACTALWRGYVATWSIEDGVLWLKEIDAMVVDPQTGEHRECTDLETLFPWRKMPIKASWYAGELRCPEGRLRRYCHANFASEYERERTFWVRRGVVEEEQLTYLPPAPLVYDIAPDGTRTYRAGRGVHSFASRDEPTSDPFKPDEPVEPWRLWGQKNWDIHPGEEDKEDAGYLVGACTWLG